MLYTYLSTVSVDNLRKENKKSVGPETIPGRVVVGKSSFHTAVRPHEGKLDGDHLLSGRTSPTHSMGWMTGFREILPHPKQVTERESMTWVVQRWQDEQYFTSLSSVS